MLSALAAPVKPLQAFPPVIPDPDLYLPTDDDLAEMAEAFDGGEPWWHPLEAEAEAVEMAARADEACLDPAMV